MIGYCVPILPKLASFRLRVALPSRHLGMPHLIGGVGDLTFFFKNGSPEVAKRLKGPVVYDVVNAHFDDPDYRRMCELATAVTCSSERMAGAIREVTGRDAAVIADPYENEERPAAVMGDRVLWFGHPANLASLKPYADLDIDVYTGADWTLKGEVEALAAAGVVLLTGSNSGASANRVIKALRAGRFVVMPEDSPQSWRDLADYVWIGDVREGVRWAFNNREEACRKVAFAQKYLRATFSPQLIGSQWAALFASTLERATSKRTAGSVSISR